MSKPTRQQIKEAFNKTIERWERILKDRSYFMASSCPLCELGDCEGWCPIFNETGGRGACHGTPYWDYRDDRTPANALAELNFLRKVYIWWIEEEKPTGVVREKKEEWVDVTEEVEWKLYNLGHGVYYWVRGYYKNEFIVWLDTEGIHEGTWAENYHIKIEKEDMSFRILKKA